MSCDRYADSTRGTSSRDRPKVVWVRSFVPNEKNSAVFAISPAVIAPRGTSIIVPTR